nr:MAG TPA: PsbP [Bacteriophage sp.]
MKRWFSLNLALLMFFCFSAAYAQSEQFSWPEYESIANEPASAITSIQFSFSTEGGVQEATVTDSKTIEGICALIQVLSITGESDMGVLDDGLIVAVNTASERLTLKFEGNIAVTSDGKRYEVENLNLLKGYLQTLMEKQGDVALMAFASESASTAEYDTYEQPDGYFTMQIPKGWAVQTSGDFISYIIDVYDPAQPQREIYIQLCGTGFQSAEGAALAQNYNASGETLFVMPEATTQSYFEGWYQGLGGSFQLLETLGGEADNALLYGEAALPNGTQTEGVYSAVVSSLEYNYGINLSMTMGQNVRVLTAVPGELDAWLPTLSACADSIQFSELFQNRHAENWSQALGTSASLSDSWNAMTDQMMALWEARIRQ